MSSANFLRLRTVNDVVAVSPFVVAMLDNYRGVHVERNDYSASPLSHIAYNRDVLRPFGQLIRSCIPASTCTPNELPDGRKDFLVPYVVSYIEKAVSVFFFFWEDQS